MTQGLPSFTVLSTFRIMIHIVLSVAEGNHRQRLRNQLKQNQIKENKNHTSFNQSTFGHSMSNDCIWNSKIILKFLARIMRQACENFCLAFPSNSQVSIFGRDVEILHSQKSALVLPKAYGPSLKILYIRVQSWQTVKKYLQVIGENLKQ